MRAHRSTLIFVNSRRVAERLAGAVNELAGEPLVRAHHGSLARPQRIEIEDKLKAGLIRGLVATSSLELGIDMGAIDLVIQIEAPPSVASGMQRIGRSGHTIDQPSRGIIVPKYRGDLVACAAVTRAMHEAQTEAIRYPRNPLDVLAQQIVAMVAMETWDVDELFQAVRGAAPFAELSRSIFDGVLDMLSGRYPSDDFADLRPRLTWDRLKNQAIAREGARRVAVINGGTIPDRGLYSVFLAGDRGPASRVGELDEEMVFESRVGETFLLGASSWRIEEITHDRVLVSAAPGQPGKMPFWKADATGRPLELGRHIGELVRSLRQMPPAAAIQRLTKHHDLDARAAENLLRYLADQAAATGSVPDDRTIVIERTRDELGDWRMCLLSPFGGRIHAPWAMAVVERVRAETGGDAETMWTDDGFVVRFPETEAPPDPALLLPASDEAEALVVRQLGGTALFAAKFREAAARALLLPRRRPGGRTPLWQQRKRAADLLAVAARFGSFPMILEAYREILRDVFDIPALVETLRKIEARDIRTVTVDSTMPSPFASALLFGYVANYIYDGDAPLAERRAQALSIDQGQLRELLGEAELRELLDADAIADVELQFQHLDERYRARSVDAVHDLLLHLGDLTADEIAARSAVAANAAIDSLTRDRRIVGISIGMAGTGASGEEQRARTSRRGRGQAEGGRSGGFRSSTPRATGMRSACRCRRDCRRRCSGRRRMRRWTSRGATRARMDRSRPRSSPRGTGWDDPTAEALLKTLHAAGRLLEGEFRPGGSGREWSDPEVLQTIRRRSLAKLRKEVEPVEPPVLARLVTSWQGLVRPRVGLDALLDAIENLQGAPLPASILESEILQRPHRRLCARRSRRAGRGRRGRVARRRAARRSRRPRRALPDRSRVPPLAALAGRGARRRGSRRSCGHLESHGASFFAAVHEAAGGGYPGETVDALWDLVWKGLLTNDTFHALRAFTRAPARRALARRSPGGGGRKRERAAAGSPFRSRRVAPPSAEGRWSLLADRVAGSRERHAVVDRDGAATAGALRRRHARSRGGRGHRRRIRRRLRRAQGARRRRARAARLLRRRRRHAVRAAPGAGAAALAARARPTSPRRSSSRPPTRPTRTARPRSGPPSLRLRRGKPATPRLRRASGGGPGADPHGGRARGARERRARGVSPARRPAGDGLPAGRRAGALDHRPRAGAGARRDWRATSAAADCSSPRSTAANRRTHPLAPFLIEAGFNPSAMGFQMPASAGSGCRRLFRRPTRRDFGRGLTCLRGRIFRTARTLNRALAGHQVVRFESVLPSLTRVHEDTPITGRTVESVTAAGKHVLMRFS